MVFSNTTNKNGLIQFIESLCKIGDGGISNDTTLLKQVTGYVNQAYREVAMAMLTVDKYWKWDDYNYTDFPIASIDLVSQQRDYALPPATVGGNASTLYRVNKVRVLSTTAGQYYTLDLLHPDSEESDDTLAGSGIPQFYRLTGNSIRLTPKPLSGNVTLTGGLEVTFQRSIVDFIYTDTTDQAGFMDSYHDLLAYKAASMYLLPINTDLALSYNQIYENRIQMMQSDYLRKAEAIPMKLTPVFRSSR